MANDMNDKKVERLTQSGVESMPDQSTSFMQQAQDFFRVYKSKIILSVLIFYVITLLIATIIELLEH